MSARGIKAVGAKILALRLERGMTQEQLARRAKIVSQYVSGCEKGRRDLSLSVLTRIAKALKVPVASLLGDLPKLSRKAHSFGREFDRADPDMQDAALRALRAATKRRQT